MSFANDSGSSPSGLRGGGSGPAALKGSWPELDLRPGMIVEWLVTGPGAGAATSALQILSRHLGGRGVWAVVDPVREAYIPAVSGWGIDPGRMLLLRPASLRETCWAIEQCLRCPGVSATWRVGPGASDRDRESPMETGGGSGRRRVLAVPPRFGPAGARVGRPASDGHAPVGRPGGRQTDPSRCAVSPGRPRRPRPGMGDRPCRG